MALLLGIDLETSGIDPAKEKIIEAGICLWDTERGPLEMKSYLIKQEEVELSAEIVLLTGITQEMMEGGYTEAHLIADLYQYHNQADYWVAHNAPFEIGFLGALFDDCASQPITKWIDTMQDIPAHVGKKLILAAAEEGILNPFPHRALPDVLTMLTLLSKFEFEVIERNALAPSRTLYVEFPYSPEKVAAIKSIGGWRWDGNGKRWCKSCKEFALRVEADKAKALGFTVYADMAEQLS